MTPHHEEPWTFNGRPGAGVLGNKESKAKNVKGTDILLEAIAPFWEVRDGRLEMNSLLNRQEWAPHQPWKLRADDDGNLKSVFTGLRPEEIDKSKEVQEEILLEKRRRELLKPRKPSAAAGLNRMDTASFNRMDTASVLSMG